MAGDSGLLRRAGVAVVVSLLVTAAAFGAALTAAADARAANRQLSQRLVPAAAAAGVLLGQYNDQQSALRNYVTGGGAGLLAVYQRTGGPVPALEARVATLVRGYGRMPGQLAVAEAAHRAWLTRIAGPQLAAAARGDFARARALQDDIPATRPYSLAVRNAMMALQAQITARQAHVTARIGGAQRYLLAALAAMGVLVAVIAAGGLLTIRRWLLVPFSALRRAAEAVAAGQYETRVPAVGPAELADLGRAVELMRIRLVAALSAAEQAEGRFRGLFDASPDATVTLAADGSIVMANAQAGRLFGRGAAELAGQPLDVLIPAAKGRAEEYLAGLGHQLGPEPVTDIVVTAVTRDGREFPGEIIVAAMPPGSGTAAVSIRDISARHAAQAEAEGLRAEAERERYTARLAQAERLESLGQLVGGVAHDFNNLLNVIAGYTGFVAEQVRGLPVADGQLGPVLEDLDQVRGATQRAVSLTRQLLIFARRDVAHPEVLDVGGVVSGIEEMLRRTLGEHITLVITAADGARRVMADSGQIEQVIVNLAINARDAMPTGGTLTIETAGVDADEAYTAGRPDLPPGSYLRLRVSDTGTGMTPEVRARAFEPFYTTKPQGSGTGLGLATVYGIITKAGGDVQVYSEPGMGTTISALLPATAETAPAAGTVPGTPAAPGCGETILLVEDEESLGELTARLLARNGYLVLTAGSPADAVRLAADPRQPVGLLLTDVVMPEMLGNEVAARATAARPGLPVLYMSGYAQPVLDTQGALGPGVDLLEKPFSESDLLTRVRHAIDEAGQPPETGPGHVR